MTAVTPDLHGTAAMMNAVTLDLGHNIPITVVCPLLADTHIHVPAVRMSTTLHSPSALRFLSSVTSSLLNRLCRNVLLLHNGVPM